MSKLIIATNNQGKVKEIKAILGGFYDEILSLKDAGIVADVVEDGKTFHENAAKKAIEISRMVSGDVLADDSGLCVDVLDGAPGIYSARFSGEDANDEKNNQKLLELVRDQANRAARFVCALVLANGGREKLYVEEYAEGRIIDEPRGENGFGYDPLFYVEEYGQTFAQIPAEVKNKISHRAKALDKLKKEVEKL
ncbi:hypothetical protein CE91St36_09780 [Christensenellaceae bacterium]|nr:hypothetical protein CE91St36_09780 [Christensenellaceae bacterium]BDF60829.1 hypothetical protein CE91St37_09790 [Christensenellaceae bacterium]